eukprot:TRINITY_DN19_c0_g1_i2.p1 TRINITY_DN19_c0_g1~~TRINITY_DN19_c0_g1_i2.p1  ORF type:complete len:457 (+),score=186.82 TRINITY_DN19_c0_g1_i2:96-1373(+)
MEALFGPELVTKGGKKPTAEVLGGKKAVLIYFSAHWCPPCRAFTPKLGEWYTKNHAKANFEIVFVSSDKTPGDFAEYHGSMPFAALPFEDRQRKGELSARFKVQGIPTLVVVAPDGKLITAKGRDKVMGDEDCNDFPWTPLTFAECLGDSLVKQGGGTVSTQEAIAGKTLAIYFSAHWCPPCRAFTPKLKEFYAEYKKLDPNFEIIFSSGDREKKEAESYFKDEHGDYLMVPFDHEKGRAGLDELFDVEGIPTLVICDAAGKLINASGRGKVAGGAAAAPRVKAEGWEPPLIGDLAEGPEALGKDINECKTVVVLLHGLAGAVNQVTTAIEPLAREMKQAGGDDGPTCIFLISKAAGGVVDQIGALTKKNGGPRCENPCSDGKPLVMLFDIPSGGAFYVSPMTEVTTDSLRSFVAAPGDRCQLER